MAHSTNVLYSPYGAYELKARYQHNMLTAILITVSTVALILLGAWINSFFAEEELYVPRHEPIIAKVWDVKPPPLIKREKPAVTAAEPVAELRVGTPTPVADTLMLDDDVLIATPDEIGRINELNNPGLPGDGRELVFDIEEDDYIPSANEIQFVEIQPEMIHGVQPKYPRLARSAGITGVVSVRALVNEEGGVDSAIVWKSSQTTSLDEAAIEAAYKNKFKPGIQNGRPVKCWVSYSVRFDLD